MPDTVSEYKGQAKKKKRTSIKSYDKSCVNKDKGNSASLFLFTDREPFYVGIATFCSYEGEAVCV